MKSLLDATSARTRSTLGKRVPKPLPEEIRHIAHQLLDHLSVVNLCSFELKRNLADTNSGLLSRDAGLLERAVEEARLCAECLSQAIAASAESQTTNRHPLKYQSKSTTSFRCWRGCNGHSDVT
jgi:hypothetical protein